jgi:hypothetical protein
MSDAAALRSALLEAGDPVADEQPRGPLRRRLAAALAFGVSLFAGYHALVLLVWNTPGGGLARQFHTRVLDVAKARPYFNGTSNSQSWAMFAPNPNRTNVFIRVLVTDQAGDTYDLKHDIWQVDRFPYWFYDRIGKINRRIDGKKSYQRIYGAWVCREWEREHGELPDHVQFVKRWTTVPTPAQAVHMGWSYEPWDLPSKQKEQETIDCENTVHAQLPPDLRERYGMEAAPEDHFRGIRIPTWWTKAEQERERAERQRRLEERGLGHLAAPAEEDDDGEREADEAGNDM